MSGMRSDSYLRKSTADAGKSVTRQETDWRRDCHAQGFEVGRAFVDPELSASRYARKARPSYAQLVENIAAGRCELLSLWESARGARNMSEWVGLLDLCREHATLIRIYGGDAETFDPRKQRDRKALLTDGITAESESETIAERSRAGALYLATTGKPPGPLLYGYTRTYDERGKFAAQHIHPERAALVRRLAAETLAGRSLNSLAVELNDAGVSSPLGGRWSGHGIARMLMNPGYVGKRVHRGEVIRDGCWEPLLSERDQRRLRALLTAPDRRAHQDSTLRYMLSGAARCYRCGKVLRAVGRLKYACVARGCMAVAAKIADVDRDVSALIVARLQKPDAADLFTPTDDSDGQLAVAQTELADLRAHLAEHVELAAARKLSAATLAAVEQRLTPQIERAEARVTKLATPSRLAEFAGVDVAAVWDDLLPATRREFVTALADVVLGPAQGRRKWTDDRLAGSRWVGDERTWGELADES
jgi:site-specific DNA recombinase